MAAAQTREASVAAPRTGRDAGEMISELQAQMSVLVDGLHAAADVRTPWDREDPGAQPHQAPRETGDRLTHSQAVLELGMQSCWLVGRHARGGQVLDHSRHSACGMIKVIGTFSALGDMVQHASTVPSLRCLVSVGFEVGAVWSAALVAAAGRRRERSVLRRGRPRRRHDGRRAHAGPRARHYAGKHADRLRNVCAIDAEHITEVAITVTPLWIFTHHCNGCILHQSGEYCCTCDRHDALVLDRYLSWYRSLR